MKLNAQQRAERLNLYGLVQGLSYVIRLNDIRTVQYLRARLALVLRNSGGLAKPLHAEIKRLFVISGVWVRNVGDRHQTKRHVLQIIRRIIPRLNRPLARRKLERGLRRTLWGNLWITLLRQRIVASHNPTTAVAEGDRPIRVLSH
jgi:hypothetical protein